MATDVDVFGIKERIADILDSDSALFDATGANNKIRKIDTGAPRMKDGLIVETTLPHIWVTNDTIIDDVRQMSSTVSNAPKTLEHNLHFRIILLAQKKDGFKVEEQLDDFVQLIGQTITENYELNNPVGGADPLADSCRILQVSELNSAQTGLDKQGRIIRLLCLKTST